MKYLLILGLLTLSGCIDSKIIKVFAVTRSTNGCSTISGVKANGVDLGNFVLCTEQEYDRRIK